MSSSRYTPSYSSRYRSGRDYGLSSYSSSRDRDYSSSRDRDSTSSYSSSKYSSRPKYSSYASKYSTDLGKSTDKAMEDYTAAPIAKDEIEELSYDAKTPTTPIDDIVDPAPREVLQESQISDFVEEEADKPTEIEEVKLTLSAEVDEPEDSEEEEVRKAQELLASSTQIREDSPVASPVASPVKEVSFTGGFVNDNNNKETENRTPSPTVLNAKKLGGIPWPPKASDDGKKEAGDTDALPKKRVSDLIARFNTGIVEENKKNDDSYKTEYGATSNVGKVSTHNFS